MKNLIQEIKYNRISVAEKFIDKVFKEMSVFKNGNHPDSKFWSWCGHVIFELDDFNDLFVSKLIILEQLVVTDCFEDYIDMFKFIKGKFSDYLNVSVVEVQDDRYSIF